MDGMDGPETFSTRNVDCDHRVKYWNMVVATTFPGMEVHIPGQSFAGQLQRWSIGEIGLMRATASRSRVLRLAQCDVGEWAVLHVIQRGHCHVSDGRRSVRASAGDLIVCDPGRPYTIDVSDRNDCLIAQVPTALMPAIGSCVDSHVTMFSGGDARVALFRHYLLGLWEYGQSLEEGGEAIMRIIAAMASTTLQGEAQRELDGDSPDTLAMLVDHVRRNRTQLEDIADHVDHIASLADPVIERLDMFSGFSKLADKQREVLTLALVYGYTHEELATVLCVPVGTAKARMRRGVQQLRVFFDQAVALSS